MRLPFADASLVHVLSRRFAIGWLNRPSLLYREKNKKGGSGAYQGARWQTGHGVRMLLAGLPMRNLIVRAANFLPSGTSWTRLLDKACPPVAPWSELLVALGGKA